MVFDHAQLKTLVREITARIHATSLSTDSDLTSRLSFLEETINSFCHDNQLTQHTLSLRGAQITALQEKPTGCEGQLEGLEVVLEQLGEQLTTSLGQVNILNARIVELELASTFTQHSSVQVNTSHPLGSAPTPLISVEASNCGHSSYDGSYRIHIWSSLSPLCYQESVGRVEENSWAWILTS